MAARPDLRRYSNGIGSSPTDTWRFREASNSSASEKADQDRYREAIYVTESGRKAFQEATQVVRRQ